MRPYAGILIIISLLLLAGTVEADDTSTISTSKDWVIANNGVGTSTITVVIQNTLGPISGAIVNFQVNNSEYGTMSPATVTSDLATGTFTVKKKSGTAIINATINYTAGGTPVTAIINVSQNIDHDTPYFDLAISPPIFTFPEQGPVNGQVPFKVSIYDKWGNPIDNRNPLFTHNIGLHVSSALVPDDCYFVGYGQDLSQPLDSNGTFSVMVKLTNKSGTNKILMDNFEGKISTQIAWITAMAVGNPYSITGSISDNGVLPANDVDKFTIDYYLYDIFGNKMENQPIWVNTTPLNEQKIFTTNSLGLIRLYYGPMVTAGDITINATPIYNSSIMNTTVAHFINSGPTNMVLSVTPQTMASLDSLATQKQAFVRATVIDKFGNPVPNESVSFSLGTVSAVGFNQTAQPALKNTTAITDKDGNAIVIFYPGAFAKWGEPGYKSAATGNVVVTATWNETSRSIKATWKNYAYLSINASAEPQTVKLNETIDITIDVVGDGYNMPGGPVTAILNLDCTKNMFSNKDPPVSGTTRADNEKTAAKLFVNEMDETKDFIGLISFGAEIDNKWHLAPQNNRDLLIDHIDNLVAKDNKNEFGDSMMLAISNITETQGSRPQLDVVRAIVVLKDSGGNIDANVSPNKAEIIAAANSQAPPIHIYTIYYSDGITNNSQTQGVLEDLASGTGGKFNKSGNSAQLNEIFIEFAHDLQKSAAVNASMILNFEKIEQVGNSTPINGSVFSYVPVPDPDSIEPFYDFNLTPKSRNDVKGRTRIFWPNSSHSVINQSDQWIAPNYQLNFTIGTIKISQRWNATYRLKATNPAGLVNLFNCTMSGSTVLSDQDDPMCLPDLFIMVTNATPPATQSGLDIWNLTITKSGKITDYVPLEWNFLYTGFSTATENLWYSYNNGTWVQYDSRPGIAPGNYTHIGQIDARGFPPGNYRIKVHGVAPDSNDDNETIAFMVSNSGTFIILR